MRNQENPRSQKPQNPKTPCLAVYGVMGEQVKILIKTQREKVKKTMVQYSETTTTLGAVMQRTCSTDDQLNDYWNIDDILSEEQCIPCTMLKDARGLAHLD